MAKPVLIAVDDDAEVFARRGARFAHALCGTLPDRARKFPGASALQALQSLKKRNEPVALFLVDQRMPEMSGVEFIAKGIDVFPEARRVLLTAYADTDAAIQAINHARIHHYLLKPWDPPEQNFYPVLDDLLSDWQASHKPVFEGVKVLGHRWSPRSYGVRDFLARNQVPYRFFDVETADRNPEIQKMVDDNGGATAKLPIAILPTALPFPNRRFRILPRALVCGRAPTCPSTIC